MRKKAQEPIEDNDEDEIMSVEQENMTYIGEKTLNDGGSNDDKLASNKTKCVDFKANIDR